MDRQVVYDMSGGTCDCAERTGELVVFTCPVCMAAALKHLRGLTKKGKLIRVDSKGSVSGLELELESYGPK